jgi:uncharacterized protein (DUF1499 family)
MDEREPRRTVGCHAAALAAVRSRRQGRRIAAAGLTVAFAGRAALALELPPCGSAPNCVSTGATDVDHAIPPIPVDVGADAAADRLRRALATLPRVQVVEDDGRHLRAEARSALFRFVDDVDLLVDEAGGMVRMRSASRVGYWDLGANRRRLEAIRGAYALTR